MAIRVYQIAKEYSRSPEEVMNLLLKKGIRVASQTAELDEHAIHTLRASLGKFDLTVVDGDRESEVTHHEAEPGKKPARPKAKKKKAPEPPPQPAPRMTVRVIKRHKEDEEHEGEQAEAPAEEKAVHKPLKKRLKKDRRSKIQERIQSIAEKRQPQAVAEGEKPAEARPEEAPKAAAASDPKAAAEKPSAQAAEPAAPEKAAEAKKQPAKPKRDKPVEKTLNLDEMRAERDRERRGQSTYRRADRPGDRRPSDRQGGRPGGDRQGGRPVGDRQGGRPGDRQGGGRPGDRQGGGRPGDRYGGRPGDRQGGGRPGDRQGGGRPGDRQGGGRPGDRYGGRPGGDRQGGGRPVGDRQGGGRPGGGRPGDRQGGGRPPHGGGRPGGGRPQHGGGPRLGGGGGGGFPGPGLAEGKPGRARFGNHKPGAKKKKKSRRNRHPEQMDKIKMVTTSRVELPDEELGIIMLSEGVTVKELSEKVDRKAKDIIKRLFEKGIMATLNDVLDGDLAIEIAKDFGYLAEIVSFEEDLQIREEGGLVDAPEEDEGTEPRAPIVTIMGHVDHGKTTLLDTIRKTKVASGEAGGITQHIGAYAVPYNEKRIVFLDTPGHEAFTKMRARGASVTDIVILVVAADDGVKPQTVEAIQHAKAAKVPIITCINKIDKPESNPERVKQMLTEHELVVEDFGGDSPCVQVSAKQNIGIDDLLEMVLLVAELNDYKANNERRARGTVIEAQLDRGRGPVATVVIQDGTVRVGQHFITGQTYGKIRAMHDDLGRNVEEAGPATPVEILGIQEVPSAGDSFQVTDDEVTARKISSFRKEQAREDHLRRQHTSLDQLFSNLKPSDIKDLSLIIKADVQGSVEGLIFALNKIESEKVNLRIVGQGVGNVTENDVLLAVASDAIIIGFNVKAERKAQDLAENEGIDLRFYSIIYEVVKEVEAAMLGLVAPTFEEREIGRASVKQVFSVAKLGKVAGCMVDDGRVKRDAIVRLYRGGDEIHTGKLQTLKRFKDDVNEVKAGFECGIGIHDYSDIEEGDEIRFFVMEEVQATEL